MTGYGRGEASGEDFTITVELKTVNNRFLDVKLRIPGELGALEARLKRIISDRLSRGRVDVNLQHEWTRPVEYELNRPLIEGYLAILKEIGEEFSLSGEPDLNHIARLPNALQPKKEEINDEFTEGILAAFGSALDSLENMRETEGNALRTEMGSLLDVIGGQLPLIESESASVAEEYAERLTKKITGLLAKSDSQVELDQARLVQEVAYLSEKSDISEEITRLKSHISQFRSIMNETEAVGKRLDFLTQELNREANTISSKTQNLTVKEAALTIKGEIEKIREQVQNIE